jgi:hypothetical protein
LARNRSFPLVDVIKFGLPNVGISNFFVPNIRNASGRLAVDVFAALTARVSEWEIAGSGSVTNDSSLFTATSVVSGLTVVALPIVSGTETEFARGKEVYPIRTPRSTASTFSSVTALTMLGAGIGQQPDAPSSLANSASGATVDGPVLSAIGTEVIANIEQGAANFELTILLRSTGRSTGGPGKDYRIDWQLQTSPVGHSLDGGGTTTPVEVGTVTINIPNWNTVPLNSGTNTFTMALYADTPTADVDNVWLGVTNDGGGGVDYSGNGITGSVDLVMTPTACHPYHDSNGNDVWDNDGNLLVPLGTLRRGEP